MGGTEQSFLSACITKQGLLSFTVAVIVHRMKKDMNLFAYLLST